MAGASAKSFLTALGIDILIGFLATLAFSILRKTKFFQRFYTAKRFLPTKELHGHTRPKRIGQSPVAWLGPVWNYSEEEVLQTSGYDAVVLLRILKFGMGLFAFLTVWMWLVVLPTNIAGGNYVQKLLSNKVPTTSQFEYWIPPPPPPAPPGSPAAPPEVQPEVPKFYAPVPPAPDGLKWYKYRPGVPPLPSVAATLGSNYTGYFWMRDPNTQAIQSYKFTNLDKASLANIPPKSTLLAVHLVSGWVMTLFTLWWLWRYAKKSVALRIRYLVTLPKGAESNTVLVEDIPGVTFGTKPHRITSFAPGFIARKVQASAAIAAAKVNSAKSKATSRSSEAEINPLFRHAATGSASPSADQTFNAWSRAQEQLKDHSMAQVVHSEFEEMFPGQVAAVHPVYDTTDLEPLDKEYDSLSQKLWDLIADYSRKVRKGKAPAPKKRKQVRVLGGTMGEWGRENFGMKPVKKDALEYWPMRLDRLREEILKETEITRSKTVPCAFVTFRNRRSQVVASTTMINHDLTTWHTSPAPAPPTIFWANVRWRTWERSFRTKIIWVLFAVMCMFYLIPIGAIQAIVNVSLLKKITPFKQLLRITFVNAIIVSILPGLVLKIFLALLPLILKIMNKKAGMQSLAEIDYGVFTKFFIFQVITVFFGSFVVGSFFSQFNQWVSNPGSAVNLIGTAVPQTAGFFLTYMAVLTFIGTPMNALQIVGLVIFTLKSKTAGTHEAKQRAWSEQYATYGNEMAFHTMAILLGLVYCVIQPVMAAMVLLYFITAYAFAKYQSIYVMRPAYESGGLIWQKVHNQVVFSLLLAQLAMVGIFGIKKVVWAPIIIALTIPFTLIVNHIMKSTFGPPAQTLSFRGATDADSNDEKESNGHQISEEDENDYVNPVFSFNERDHTEILEQAANIDLILKGERNQDQLMAEPEEDDDDIGGDTPFNKSVMNLPRFGKGNKSGSVYNEPGRKEEMEPGVVSERTGVAQQQHMPQVAANSQYRKQQ